MKNGTINCGIIFIAAVVSIVVTDILSNEVGRQQQALADNAGRWVIDAETGKKHFEFDNPVEEDE